MPTNPSPWQWTGQKEKAAAYVADDFLTDREIARKIKVGIATLEVWKRQPEFKARVAELVKKLKTAQERYAIARRMRRVAALDKRWEDLQAIKRARARDKHHRKAPGG